MKLNLGSNDQRFDGFFNVDHRAGKNVDIVDDAFILKTIKAGSVDEVVASHLLEHACFDRTNDILTRWKEILVPGGKLWIAVPDFGLVMGQHFDNLKTGKITWEFFNSRIFGNAEVAKKMYGIEILEEIQGVYKYEMAFHKAVFNKDMLESAIKKAGFKEVTIIDRLPFKAKHIHEICCVGTK